MIEVVPFVFRGPRPKDLSELMPDNIRHVLSLEAGVKSLFYEDKFETQLAEAYNIGQSYVDMSGIWPPEKHDVEQAIRIINHCVANGINVYVHCMAGKDRTGFVIAVYRMQMCGWSRAKAIEEYKAMGLHYRFYWWIRFLAQYEKAEIV